jgi:GNAT superfamily N-acetyltransferase
MGEILIRHPHADDRNDLSNLMFEYIVDFYKRPAPPAQRVHGLFEMLQEGREGTQFIAERDGKLVGFATLYYTYSTLRAQKAAVMNDLYVVETERGTGAAAELFEACRKHVQDNGFAYMSWETAADNKRAQKFYDKMGGQAGDWITYSI